jgi:hypothetical protein
VKDGLAVTLDVFKILDYFPKCNLFIKDYLLIRLKKESCGLLWETRKHPRVKTTNLISYVCIDDSGSEIEQSMGRL